MSKATAPTGAELLALLREAAEIGALPTNLAGYTFVFTGTLSMKRDDLKALVRVAGGRTDDRVSWGRRIVLVHGDTGRHGRTTKMVDATSHGALVWNESQLCTAIVKGVDAV